MRYIYNFPSGEHGAADLVEHDGPVQPPSDVVPMRTTDPAAGGPMPIIGSHHGLVGNGDLNLHNNGIVGGGMLCLWRHFNIQCCYYVDML